MQVTSKGTCPRAPSAPATSVKAVLQNTKSNEEMYLRFECLSQPGPSGSAQKGKWVKSYFSWSDLDLLSGVLLSLPFEGTSEFIVLSLFNARDAGPQSLVGLVVVDLFSFLLAPCNREYELVHSVRKGKLVCNIVNSFSFSTAFYLDDIKLAGQDLHKMTLTITTLRDSDKPNQLKLKDIRAISATPAYRLTTSYPEACQELYWLQLTVMDGSAPLLRVDIDLWEEMKKSSFHRGVVREVKSLKDPSLRLGLTLKYHFLNLPRFCQMPGFEPHCYGPSYDFTSESQSHQRAVKYVDKPVLPFAFASCASDPPCSPGSLKSKMDVKLTLAAFEIFAPKSRDLSQGSVCFRMPGSDAVVMGLMRRDEDSFTLRSTLKPFSFSESYPFLMHCRSFSIEIESQDRRWIYRESLHNACSSPRRHLLRLHSEDGDSIDVKYQQEARATMSCFLHIDRMECTMIGTAVPSVSLMLSGGNKMRASSKQKQDGTDGCLFVFTSTSRIPSDRLLSVLSDVKLQIVIAKTSQPDVTLSFLNSDGSLPYRGSFRVEVRSEFSTCDYFGEFHLSNGNSDEFCALYCQPDGVVYSDEIHLSSGRYEEGPLPFHQCILSSLVVDRELDRLSSASGGGPSDCSDVVVRVRVLNSSKQMPPLALLRYSPGSSMLILESASDGSVLESMPASSLTLLEYSMDLLHMWKDDLSLLLSSSAPPPVAGVPSLPSLAALFFELSRDPQLLAASPCVVRPRCFRDDPMDPKYSVTLPEGTPVFLKCGRCPNYFVQLFCRGCNLWLASPWEFFFYTVRCHACDEDRFVYEPLPTGPLSEVPSDRSFPCSVCNATLPLPSLHQSCMRCEKCLEFFLLECPQCHSSVDGGPLYKSAKCGLCGRVQYYPADGAPSLCCDCNQCIVEDDE